MINHATLAHLIKAVEELNIQIRGRDAADGRIPTDVVDVIEDVLTARDALYLDDK